MTKKLKFSGTYEQRALIAYIKSNGAEAALKVQKMYKRSMGSRRFVVLANMLNNPVATYRIQIDGSLRRMVRPPRNVVLNLPPLTRPMLEEYVGYLTPAFERADKEAALRNKGT